MQRKLTAILSADVAGYSGLMEVDEAGTLQRLKVNRRDIFDPQVVVHGGRQFKLMGDGALVEFSSAVAAVNCALAIQAETEKIATEPASANPIRYRIGINLGEVIVEGDDIYGEGVNVAARIQALAPIDGVAVSKMVRDNVDGKMSCTFEDMGEHVVKNIERPIHVYLVRTATPETNVGRTLGEPPKLSICVLPFLNMSGDAEQEYFSDGISEDIITDLSKVSSLFVVARNSAFTFKGKSVKVPHLARDLNVTHVLEGSVRKANGRVRITAQLIDGATGGHVWAERYDRDLTDIFALQDEISGAIVGALKLRLLPEEKKAIETRSTANPEAYELYLMARQFAVTGHDRHRSATARLCRRATELDPNYARAWALLAISLANMRIFDLSKDDNGFDAAERALSLDPNLAEAHSARGRILSEMGRYDEAWKEHQRALLLDSEAYDVNAAAARCAIFLRLWDEAISMFEQAARVAEDDFWALGMAIQCYEAKNDSAGARSAAQRCLARVEKLIIGEPDHGDALSFGIAALATLGEKERARSWIRRSLLLDPENIRLRYNVACVFTRLGEFEEAFGLLEPVMRLVPAEVFRFMKADTSLDGLRQHERYAIMVAETEKRLERGGS